MQAVTRVAPSVAIEAYSENILIDACGPILSPVDVAKRLIFLPKRPNVSDGSPAYVREHQIADICRMHIPTAAGIDIANSLGFMIRQGYVHRNPTNPGTWRRIYAPGGVDSAHSAIQMAGTVVGIPGVGKTTAIERALGLLPQAVIHEKFPGIVGPVRQLLWLKIDVPASGKIVDLIENFSRATDVALGVNYTDDIISGRNRRGAALAHQWLQKIFCHFPGVFVLDEIQNLFKIETKAVRAHQAWHKKAKRPSLRIVDDEALKFLLTLTNTTKIPILVAGTPDGIEAFGSRMSTAQRLVTAGFHRISHAVSADDEFFRKHLFPNLCCYQWHPESLAPTDEFRFLLHELSGGIPRICMALWIHAHKRSFQRGASRLEFDDFRHAAANALAPLQPAVRALLSGDPMLQLQYEDMLPNGGSFWLA